MAKLTMKELIVSVILIVVGVTLIPVLNGAIVAANITDATLALAISLIPLIFVFVLVLAMVDVI